ncbi:Phosphatidylserine synthase 2 [Smittium culicis]|uniref:Phosphatidylserine synthase 2 n=1 Tax=Smittium culicis TaxID=133412 RepID=A0A1R1YT77_9FUNG|nr:Phosphatidylserine synthase 2 [Smittium culicis]
MAKGSIKASPRISPDSDSPDPTLSFFNKPHTITLLVSTFLFLLYVAFYTNDTDENINNKWGLGAGSMVFIIIGIVLFRDGPFIRPHPAMWRAVLAMNVLYEMGLIYILFQNKASARGTMKFFDSKLGIPLPEKSYAENCEFTPANVWDGIDIFVLAHSLGWFGKALILRDNLICWIISIFFELCEYSLEHQLANFAECWWDHWLLDVLICNWLGIYVGNRWCEYFEVKTYQWNGIRQIPTIKGKIKRAGAQFTPHSWTSYEWAPTRRLFNYFGFVILILAFTLAELNVFYLKYLLWVPPEHYLVIARLSLIFLFGIPCVREYYEFYSNPNCKKIGIHAWLMGATILTELLIIFKFSSGEFTNPFPKHVVYGWSIAFSLVTLYPVWQFFIKPRFFSTKKQKQN